MITINFIFIKRLRRNKTYIYYTKKIIIKKYKNLIVTIILDDNYIISYLNKDVYNNNNYIQNLLPKSKLLANSILKLKLLEEEYYSLYTSLINLTILLERRIRYISKKESVSSIIKYIYKRFEHLNLSDTKLLIKKLGISIFKENQDYKNLNFYEFYLLTKIKNLKRLTLAT